MHSPTDTGAGHGTARVQRPKSGLRSGLEPCAGADSGTTLRLGAGLRARLDTAPKRARACGRTCHVCTRLTRLIWQTMAAIAAFVAVAGGYGAKPSRVQRAELALTKAEVGSHEAENAYRQLKAALH